jgi:hypothetical protein
LIAAGFAGTGSWGENIAAAYPDPQAVVRAWMASPGHRANILNPAFTHLGIGAAVNPGSRWGYYWTLDFGILAGGAAEAVLPRPDSQPPVSFSAPAPGSELRASVTAPAQIDLAWSLAARLGTGIGIWRKAGPGDWERIAVVVPSATRFSDRGVTAEQTYVYRVRAHNQWGASAWSNEVSAVTPLLAPGGLSVQVLAPTRVQLTWTDNSGSETGFGIWRKESGGAWGRIGVAAANAMSFVDRDATAGRSYVYRIRAHNNHGASGWSNEATGTTPAVDGP